MILLQFGVEEGVAIIRIWVATGYLGVPGIVPPVPSGSFRRIIPQ
jgi:hypothetical protein